jgi:multiphosphoryl transfer protein
MPSEVTVRTAVALHARPLDAFVRLARTFEATITVHLGGARQADGKTVIKLLLLAVPAGAEVTLTAEGEDAEAALAALGALLQGSREGGDASRRADAATAAPAVSGASRRPSEQTITGAPGAPGIARGRALREAAEGSDQDQPAGTPDEERARFDAALAAARAATAALIDDDDPFSDIFRAQSTLLDDATIVEAVAVQLTKGAAAGAAVRTAFAELGAQFEALGAGFAAERHADVADVRDRILEALGHARLVARDDGRADPLVLLLEEATPSRVAGLDPARVAALVSARGGPTSHAAIVARARRVPLVFAPAALTAEIVDGAPLEVDGAAGTLTPLSADADLGADADLDAGARAQTATADLVTAGHTITLRANLGAPGDLELAAQLGCQGCGLLRTELLFAGRAQSPSVEDQARAYARVADKLAPHPVNVRLFDAGSDKPLPFLPTPAAEPNPALGLRGLRLLERYPAVLRDQLEALALARRQSGLDLRAMVPMVVDADDLRRVRALLAGLGDDGEGDALPLGAMIETPAAVELIDELLQVCAFVSIGSNDLAQYTLAADREARQAYGAAHPALLRQIERVAAAARAAGVECSVCGELAGDPEGAPLLVQRGVTVLSLSPAQAPVVRGALARSASGERSLS